MFGAGQRNGHCHRDGKLPNLNESQEWDGKQKNLGMLGYRLRLYCQRSVDSLELSVTGRRYPRLVRLQLTLQMVSQTPFKKRG